MNRGVDSWGYCEGTHFCDIKSYMKSHFFIAEGEVGSDVFFIWTVLMDHLFLTILDLYFSIQLYLYVKIIVNKVFFVTLCLVSEVHFVLRFFLLLLGSHLRLGQWKDGTRPLKRQQV